MNTNRNPIFQLNVPNETRMRFFKLRSKSEPDQLKLLEEELNEKKGQADEKCSHKTVVTCKSGYCVLDYYCYDCGEWLGDKDVS